MSFVLIIKDYIGHKNRETKSVIYGFICLILAILIQVIEVYREEYSLYNTWSTYSILLALVTQLFALFWKVSRKDRFQMRQTRYQLLLDSSEGILFELSLNDKTFITSDKIYEKFGWKLPNRVKNFSVNVILEVFHVHPEDDIIMKVAVLTMLKNHTFVSDVVRIMKEDGSYLWCKIKVAPLYDENGELISLVGKIVDVDEQVRENQHLKMETRLDGLTGLLNKKTLTTEAMKYMKENSCKNSCMIFIDLDNFKRVNDILGHCIGDQAIVDAANKIKEIFSNYVYVGRFGGDEFCIFLREITRDDLEKLLLKCQRRLQEVYVKDKTIISVSSSIGAAYCLSDKVDYDILLNLADEAECAIKNSGGNGYIIREYENS